ncbi:MAG: PfkB family carbohydrate kinase [Phycisphaerales bacterium JB037]
MPPQDKILSHDELLRARAEARREGRRVVQCHGCFDIVHPGHVRHLRYARAQGDVLLVSITGDASVGKGDGRPLIPQELRGENLAELDCVDWVYIEPRPTAAELLAEVEPDIYIKGREYEFNNDPRFAAERDAVERAGGRVLFSSGDVVFSSTALIAAMERAVDPFHKRVLQLTGRAELGAGVLSDLVAQMRGRSVVVVGECIRDTYVMCDQPEVAGESPVMTLRPIQRREFDGGAAIVARHAAAMGARPTLVTVLPRGAEGAAWRDRLAGEGVEVVAIESDQPVPEKQRYLVGAQKVMKVDLVPPAALDAHQHEQLVELARGACGGGVDAGVVCDFGLGVFTPPVVRKLCKAMRAKVGVLSGDVSGRRASLRAMVGLDLVLPSERELRDALHRYDEGLPAVAWKLLEETGIRSAIVTMGPDGLVTFDRLADASSGEESDAWRRRLRSEHIPALAPVAIDALGCGDALLTAATLARSAGADAVQSAFLGAVAAAAQAQRLGNLPVSASDLRQGVHRVHSAHLAYAAAEVIGSRTTREPAARAS